MAATRIAFELQRQRRWFSSSSRGTVGDALKDRYSLTLRIDGQTVALGSRGEPGVTTSWDGRKKEAQRFLAFLAQYRQNPGQPIEEEVCSSLHHFLFAGATFDVIFGQKLDKIDELAIYSGAFDPLIVNVPWELTAGVFTGKPRPLLGTFASLPLVRVIENTQSQLVRGEKERLRVVYCVSQPEDSPSIRADDFERSLSSTLHRRAGMLDAHAVVAPHHSPTFSELLAKVSNVAPHVLVVVCHGQTANGEPQLRFENWRPVLQLAAALSETNRAFLVVLIACDQVFLDQAPAAHSGALTLLGKGVPYVVAMQSSVRADLAGEFLGQMLDHLFETGSVPQSVCAGRKAMVTPADDAASYSDWSFPSLFGGADAHREAGELKDMIEGYVPALKALARSIPLPEPYLSRPEHEECLGRFLSANATGLRALFGGPGMGKTFLVRHACLQQIDGASRSRDTSFRPLLYVDLERYPEPLTTTREIISLLSKAIERAQPSGGGTRLFSWPNARGADGTGQADDALKQLIALLDNRIVLVVDHLPPKSIGPWQELLQAAHDLRQSLLLAISEEAIETAIPEHVLQVGPLDQEESGRYLAQCVRDPTATATVWYERTGGVPYLLGLLRAWTFAIPRTPLPPREIEREAIRTWLQRNQIERLPGDQRRTLAILTLMRRGLSPELAWTLGINGLTLLELEAKSILVREARAGDAKWFRVPGLVRDTLQEVYAKEVGAAAEKVADTFTKRARADAGVGVEPFLCNLGATAGGLAFLHDIHHVFLICEWWGQALGMAWMLHQWLFSNSRWYDAFLFWRRLLDSIPDDQVGASEWIKLASAAQVLGYGKQAGAALAKAKVYAQEPIDQIDALMVLAALIKDSGPSGREEVVLQLYVETLELIAQGERTAPHEDRDHYRERYALVLYNRALFRAFVLRMKNEALTELEASREEFTSLGLKRMGALASCEWVDIQLSSSAGVKDWQEMKRRLWEALEAFKNDFPADRAFVFYQLARLLRHWPPGSEEHRLQNLAEAKDAYRCARDEARLAGDLRQEQVAEAHLVEISWRCLRELSDAEASRRLQAVVDGLKGYEGDAWSNRVRRDALLLWAEADPSRRREALNQAWRVATALPLQPRRGTDARRAAQVLVEFLHELRDARDRLEFDKTVTLGWSLIEVWLGPTVRREPGDSFLGPLEAFGSLKGEAHGQSTG